MENDNCRRDSVDDSRQHRTWVHLVVRQVRLLRRLGCSELLRHFSDFGSYCIGIHGPQELLEGNERVCVAKN